MQPIRHGLRFSQLMSLVYFLAGHGLWAAEESLQPQGYYVGFIGEQLKLQMDLTLDHDGHRASGTYYYDHIGKPLTLQGHWAPDGKLTLQEYDARRRMTGRFHGSFSKMTTSFSGSWTSADGQRQLTCQLRQVADYDVLWINRGRYVTAVCRIPQLIDQPQRRHINLNLRRVPYETTKDFVNSMRPLLAEHETTGYERRLCQTITYYSPTFLSILVADWQYTGGAHGNVDFKSRNLLIRNGRLIEAKWHDLFEDAQAAERVLSEYCLRDLKRQRAAWVLDKTVRSFQLKDLVLTASPRGLQATFAPYSVGPYSSGVHEVTIPFATLTSVLHPEGPLMHLVAATRVAATRAATASPADKRRLRR